jgi:16S rRNA C967 or C1407 C5-methylase (RsmB/RsmF family)
VFLHLEGVRNRIRKFLQFKRKMEESTKEMMVKNRFIRLIKGQSLINPSLVEENMRIPWLKRLQVYRLNSSETKLSQEEDFVSGNCVGIDASSCLVCECLDPQPGQSILDLCCAPGMKLSAIAELMNKQGTLVGVDISEARLNTTSALLRKFKVCLSGSDEPLNDNWDVTIWRGDGTTWDPQAKKGILQWSTRMNGLFLSGKPLRIPRKRAGRLLRKNLATQAMEETEEKAIGPLFDRILVDAECTTDGRAHRPSPSESQYKKKKWSGEGGLASQEEQAVTEKLQLELLSNGFRLLKKGGVLVYSTCSLTEGQNEGVLSRFMDTESSAQLIPPAPWLYEPGEKIPPFVVPSTTLGHLGWRLSPESSGTSGMFIARLTKI